VERKNALTEECQCHVRCDLDPGVEAYADSPSGKGDLGNCFG